MSDTISTKMTEPQIFSHLLSTVARTEAKVDLLLIELAQRNAQVNGTSQDEEIEIIQGAVAEKLVRTIREIEQGQQGK